MIGKNVKYYREKLGISQTELAERMGYKSKSTISKIEKDINDVNQTKILQLAKALNCDPTDLTHAVNGLEKVIKKRNDQNKLTDFEKRVIDAYRKSDPITQQNVCAVLGVRKERE